MKEGDGAGQGIIINLEASRERFWTSSPEVSPLKYSHSGKRLNGSDSSETLVFSREALFKAVRLRQQQVKTERQVALAKRRTDSPLALLAPEQLGDIE